MNSGLGNVLYISHLYWQIKNKFNMKFFIKSPFYHELETLKNTTVSTEPNLDIGNFQNYLYRFVIDPLMRITKRLSELKLKLTTSITNFWF